MQGENANFAKNFSDRLVLLRSRHNLTQAELARKLNVSLRSVQNWEREEHKPWPSLLRKIREIFPDEFAAFASDVSGKLCESAPVYGGISMQCIEHLRRWLARIESNPNLAQWTLEELRKRFPLEDAPVLNEEKPRFDPDVLP